MVIKYNKKWERWCTDEGEVYRQTSTGKFIKCGFGKTKEGYLTVRVKGKSILCHRLMWETFVSKIPPGMEIDHQDTHKENNELSNLKLCTHKENCNNPLTRKHKSESKKGVVRSYFGEEFKKHYGITKTDDVNLYGKEIYWYRRYGKLRWEMEK
jgi:hypothetical protein